MDIRINTSIDISKVLGIGIRKALEFKKVRPFSDDELEDFITNLLKDEDFIDAYKNIIKIN